MNFSEAVLITKKTCSQSYIFEYDLPCQVDEKICEYLSSTIGMISCYCPIILRNVDNTIRAKTFYGTRTLQMFISIEKSEEFLNKIIKEINDSLSKWIEEKLNIEIERDD